MLDSTAAGLTALKINKTLAWVDASAERDRIIAHLFGSLARFKKEQATERKQLADADEQVAATKAEARRKAELKLAKTSLAELPEDPVAWLNEVRLQLDSEGSDRTEAEKEVKAKVKHARDMYQAEIRYIPAVSRCPVSSSSWKVASRFATRPVR